MEWTQDETAALILRIDESDDPVSGAMAVIGAMIALVDAHNELDIVASALQDWLTEYDIQIERHEGAPARPVLRAANSDVRP